jgi:S1-C subfamily serine protease
LLVGGASASPANYSKPAIAMPAATGGPALSAVDFFKRISPSVYLIEAAKDAAALRDKDEVYEGSAVAITPTLALTNCHIVEDRKKLVLIQQDSRDTNVVVVASDPATDRCIIRTRTMTLNPISGMRAYRDLAVGEKVFTVGNPSGFTATLSEGIVSGLRVQDGVHYVQTSAAISPGSSGGGLFDERGNLLGITTFMIEDSQNLNFAIAAEEYWQKGPSAASRPRQVKAADGDTDDESASGNTDTDRAARADGPKVVGHRVYHNDDE